MRADPAVHWAGARPAAPPPEAQAAPGLRTGACSRWAAPFSPAWSSSPAFFSSRSRAFSSRTASFSSASSPGKPRPDSTTPSSSEMSRKSRRTTASRSTWTCPIRRRRRPRPTGGCWSWTSTQTEASACPRRCAAPPSPRADGRPDPRCRALPARRPDLDLLHGAGGEPLPSAARPLRAAQLPGAPELPQVARAVPGGAARRAGGDDGLPGRGHGRRLRGLDGLRLCRALEKPGRAAAGVLRSRSRRGSTFRPRIAPCLSGIAGEIRARRARRMRRSSRGARAEWLVRRTAIRFRRRFRAVPGDPLVRWISIRPSPATASFSPAPSSFWRAPPASRPGSSPGFRGGTWNGYSNNFTVRNSDAHAWAEIWDEAPARLASRRSAGGRLRRGRRPDAAGRGGAGPADGPQLVRPARKPARLLVPADRELRPGNARSTR